MLELFPFRYFFYLILSIFLHICNHVYIVELGQLLTSVLHFFLMLLFQFSEGNFSSYEDANRFETKKVIDAVKKNSKPSILLFTTNNGPAIRSSNITGVFPDSYELYRKAGLESAMVLKNTPECSFCGNTNKLLTARQSDYPDAIVDHVLFNKTLSKRIVEVTVRPVLLQSLSFSILEKKNRLQQTFGMRKAVGFSPTSTTQSRFFQAPASLGVQLMCNLSSEKVRLLFECSFLSSAAFIHDFTVLGCADHRLLFTNWILHAHIPSKNLVTCRQIDSHSIT